MNTDLDRARRAYAQQIVDAAGASEAFRRALEAVPRERFLGAGPWKILRVGSRTYTDTPDADPVHLCDDVLVAIDATRRLNNGHPSSLVRWLGLAGVEQGTRFLHVGCGVGYYTAVAAEVIGDDGLVVAVEVDAVLAKRAVENLSERSNTRVVEGDGSGDLGGPFDAIFVNAGATEVPIGWLEALAEGGTMLLPLTVDVPSVNAGVGHVLRIGHRGARFDARFVTPIGVFHCQSARTAAGNERLSRAFRAGSHESVMQVRTDAHREDATCWLHGEVTCVSTIAAT